MKTARLLLFGLVLLAGLRAEAQGWDALPKYTYRPGGRAQVRRIIWCEDYERASPGFLELRDSSSVEELVRLSHRHNPAMRLYAAMALADRHYPHLDEVFARLLRKDRPIRYSYYRWGALQINYIHASEKLYDRIRFSEAAARSHLHPAFPARTDSLLYETILHRMDSVALQLASQGRHVHYSLLDNCLAHNQAYPGSYEFVGQLCRAVDPQKWDKRGYAAVVAALAAYRRDQDVALLLCFDDNIFPAVAQFPHPAFWPLIEQYRAAEKYYRGYGYYEAVAAFNNPRAAQLLDSLVRFDIRGEGPASNMAEVLSKNPISTFHQVAEQLWVQHHTTRLKLVAPLMQRNPRQAATTFAEGFLNFKPDDKAHFGMEYDRDTDSVATKMLRAIWQQDSATFRRVARHGVQVFRWHELTGLCLLDKQCHFSWFRPLLLAELRAATRPFDQYAVASALLDYNDAATTASVKQTLAENAAFQASTDSWCESIRKRLASLNASAAAKP